VFEVLCYHYLPTAQSADIDKRVTCYTLRHSCATTMLEIGTNIRILQELMGHADAKTTERYTHVKTQQKCTVYADSMKHLAGANNYTDRYLSQS